MDEGGESAEIGQCVVSVWGEEESPDRDEHGEDSLVEEPFEQIPRFKVLEVGCAAVSGLPEGLSCGAAAHGCRADVLSYGVGDIADLVACEPETPGKVCLVEVVSVACIEASYEAEEFGLCYHGGAACIGYVGGLVVLTCVGLEVAAGWSLSKREFDYASG